MSRSRGARGAVVHVHGYGGDFFSNRFLDVMHEVYPAVGYHFVAVGLRTMGYLMERYSEGAVEYVGSAVISAEDAVLDLEAVIGALGIPPAEVIIQGHSFGTNVAKRYLESRPDVSGFICLSAADSVALHEGWLGTSKARQTVKRCEEAAIVFDAFGMAAGQSAYQIPISLRTRSELLESRTFRAWSGAEVVPLGHSAVIVQGGADPIAAVGNTGRAGFFATVLPNGEITRIDGAGHLLAGYEHRIVEVVADWLRARRC